MSLPRITDLLANIKATIVSFLSIVMFVTLGVGLYLGIHGAASSLERAATIAYREGAFHDLEVIFPYGLDDDDLQAIRAVSGVEAVEPAYLSYERQKIDGTAHSLAVHSLTESIDLCDVVEGVLPTTPNEIALTAGYTEKYGIGVGDQLSFIHDVTDETDRDGMRSLTGSDFTVTGIVTNPSCLAQANLNLGMADDGSIIKGFAYVTKDAFDSEAFGTRYPRAVVRASSLAGLDPFSEEYDTRANELKDALVAVGKPRAEQRFATIKAEAQAQVDAAQAKIEEGEAALDEASTQIADGEAAIEQGRLEIETAIAQLKGGQASYETTKEHGERMLASMRESLASMQTAHDEAEASLAEQRKRIEKLEGQLSAYEKAQSALAEDLSTVDAELEEVDSEYEEGIITEEERQQKRQEIIDRANARIAAFEKLVNDKYPLVVAYVPSLASLPRLTYGDDSPSAAEISYNTSLATYAISAALAEMEGQLDKTQADLDDLDKKLGTGWSEYYQAEADLNASLASAEADLSAGREQVAQGQSELDQRKTELEEGKELLEERSSELEESRSLVEDSQQQVDSLEYMSWNVSTRSTSGGSIALTNIINLTNNLRVAMASLFVIVGLLVCYSAISRIVHEQVTQIGTKKAMGFRDGEITRSYLSYTVLAVLLGLGLGIACSLFVVQGILYPTLSSRFDMPGVGPSFELGDAALIGLVELVLLLISTWLACRSVLRRNAIELLAGEQAGSGVTRFYERWGIWKKLPLLTQAMINNCVNDPRRVFATVIGVAGCTALVVTAISLDGNITRSINRHFGLVFDYDATVLFDEESEGAQRRLEDALTQQGAQYAVAQSSLFLLEDEGEPAYESILVPKDEESFAKLFHLNAVPSSGVAPTQGAWLSQSHAEHRGLQVGDQITVCTVTGKRYRLTIAGFFTYYLPNNMIVMGPDYYERVFEEEAVPNALLVATGKDGVSSLSRAIGDIEGFRSMTDEHERASTIVSQFKSVTSTVVRIYIILSALMALIVLLNLDYMFIDEKKRELIVLMINGFSVGDAKAYIYRDAIVMTILGIGLGIGLGIIMGSATVAAIEWQSCSFIKDAYLPACLAGAGMSAVFAAAMMLVALRRIPRFSLTDITRY